MILSCTAGCGPFRRQGTRGPIPLYCSVACKARHKRNDRRRKYEREYRRTRRAKGLDLTDNAARRDYYRERWQSLHGDAGVEIPQPYTGHRWFDMARDAVNGGRDVDPAFRDFGYNDEVGEAVLALLEGRDMGQALKDYRAHEFVPRHLTLYLGDWKDDDEGRESTVMPSVPSAEDEYLAQEPVTYSVKARYHHGQNDRPTNGSRQSRTQPSRKRTRDGKSWMKHAAA